MKCYSLPLAVGRRIILTDVVDKVGIELHIDDDIDPAPVVEVTTTIVGRVVTGIEVG